MEQKINVYTHEEAYEASLEYFKGDELAARVWVNKYALKDSFGNIYEKTLCVLFGVSDVFLPCCLRWRGDNTC